MRKITLLSITVWLIFTGPIHGQDTYKDSKNEEFDARGIREFHLNLDSGFDVRIKGTDTQKISYSYHFEGNRLAFERNFKQADVEWRKNAGFAVLTVRFPDLEDLEPNWVQQLLNNGGAELHASKQELVLEVPTDLAIELGTRYSDVKIENIRRSTRIHTRSGTVEARQIYADLHVENEYGDNTVSHVEGNLTVQSRSSSIRGEDISGKAEINSSYSNVYLQNIGADAKIRNLSGEIDLRDVRGTAEIESDYTKVQLENISGEVTVHSKSGKVTASSLTQLVVEGEYTNVEATRITGTEGVQIRGQSNEINLSSIKGAVSISGAYLNIRLSDILEDVRISNQSGSIHTRSVEGDVEIQSSFSDIQLENFLGHRLNISNQSGDVTIAAQKTISEAIIDSQYGNVNITLHQPFEGKIFLEALYGNIQTNLQIQKEESDTNRSGNRQISRIRGSVDSGSNVIHVTAQNGDITLQQE